MLKSFTIYDLLIFVILDYTEFDVLANSNGLVDYYLILYHASLIVSTCLCEDLARFINYFGNRDRKKVN